MGLRLTGTDYGLRKLVSSIGTLNHVMFIALIRCFVKEVLSKLKVGGKYLEQLIYFIRELTCFDF